MWPRPVAVFYGWINFMEPIILEEIQLILLQCFGLLGIVIKPSNFHKIHGCIMKKKSK